MTTYLLYVVREVVLKEEDAVAADVAVESRILRIG